MNKSSSFISSEDKTRGLENTSFIPYGRHYIDEADIQAIVDVLYSNNLTQGPKIAKFEEAIANYVGARYAVAVSSGTAALHLACIAANVGPGKYVITSPNTFIASANCALYVGAKPQFVDIDESTLNIDPAELKTKCDNIIETPTIIAVHFAGLACDMRQFKEVADSVGANIIEDAAHALGSVYADGRKVGCCAFSDMTVFSFHPVKVIASGEGGMITTNNENIYRHLLRLRSHGINKSNDAFLKNHNAFDGGKLNPWYYEMHELGYNYRITDIQSALALSQLSKIEKFLSHRLMLAARYDQAFADTPHLVLPQREGRKHSANHLYVLRIRFDKIGMSRRQFMVQLKEKGIGTQVHYIPIPAQPYYEKMGHKMSHYPNMQRYYEQALSIPIYYGLTEKQQDHVIDSIQALIQ